MKPIAVIASGMVTGVGLTAASTCAAIHCAIDNFQETRFVDSSGEWIVASEVPLDPPVRGRSKLIKMAASTIAECLAAIKSSKPVSVPLLLCVSEQDRPGRFDRLDESLIHDIATELQVPFSSRSQVFANGAVGGVQAIERAFELIHQESYPFVIVAGTDTLLVAGTLTALDKSHRLLTPSNSNGLIPGEGAAAILLGPAADPRPGQFILRGFGYGREPAPITSEEPLRADGMSEAIRDAFRNSGLTYDDVDYRITDISGEQYAFKEAALAASRTMKTVKEEFDIWHPADCVGDTGAANVPTMVAVAKSAAENECSGGDGVLFHCSNDDEQRAVIVGGYLDPEDDHE